MKVVVGGTFDILHEGHKALLRKAFSLGNQLLIGLTSDKMAGKTRSRQVKVFGERKKVLENFLVKEFSGKAHIVKINNVFGPTLKEDFDYIVVSPKTHKTALLINKERQKLGKRSIEIVKINFIWGKDGKLVSATRLIKNARLRS